MKTIQVGFVIGILVLMMAGSATAQYVFPTVTFEFVPANFSYIYTVTMTPQDTFPLGYVEVDTLVQNGGLTPWTMLGPVANSVDLNWNKASFPWAPGCDAASWQVLTPEQEIFPSDWVGVFTLIVPNTQPVDGFALTMDGSEWSVNPFAIEVPGPGPIVPEPSGLLALSGLLGTAGMLFRRCRA